MNPKEHNWLTRLTTGLVAFCAFILVDIYKDFKEVREEVRDHRYKLEVLNYKYDDISYDLSVIIGSYQVLMNDKTVTKSKPLTK